MGYFTCFYSLSKKYFSVTNVFNVICNNSIKTMRWYKFFLMPYRVLLFLVNLTQYKTKVFIVSIFIFTFLEKALAFSMNLIGFIYFIIDFNNSLLTCEIFLDTKILHQKKKKNPFFLITSYKLNDILKRFSFSVLFSLFRLIGNYLCIWKELKMF